MKSVARIGESGQRELAKLIVSVSSVLSNRLNDCVSAEMFPRKSFFWSAPMSGNWIIKSTVDRMAAIDERSVFAMTFKC